MKNRIQDVRNHLVNAMEALGDPDTANAETIERAKAISGLANAFTQTVRVELDARKMAGKESELPDVLTAAPRLTGPAAPAGTRTRS